MENQKNNSKTTKWFLFIISICFLSIVGYCILANYDKDFQFNLFNEDSSDYSLTKEEAIKRKTFICDIETPTNPYLISKTHILYLKSGWIEQPWRDGFWYWTTNKDTSSNSYYNIIVIYNKSKSDPTDWRIINKPENNNDGYGIQLQDNKVSLTGTLDSLPASDTLRYTVLKRDTIDFNPKNIEGVLTLILKRHISKIDTPPTH